ncbi:hypothetical protein E7V67_010585 [[Empedobacter] haloabium]|uniref:Methyl-accepting chemotaxis protein n=1 Tax=[Empedobacter] haloabium TaxID=592317 RepID=A0ABZ1US61_9BURK
MGIRDTILTTVALALCLLALAVIVSTDVYSHTAGTEAKGLGALQREVLSGTQLAAASASEMAASAGAAR